MPTKTSTSTTRRRSPAASRAGRTTTRATRSRSGSTRRTTSARAPSKSRGTTRSTSRSTSRHRTRSSSSAARNRTTHRSAATGQRDAIAILREQHQEVERLFKEFDRLGDGARQSRRRLIERIVAELARHASIEEQYFYPAVRREVAGSDSDVLRALEEHHVVTWELDELDGLDPADDSFGPKASLLIDNVRRHVRTEEREIFPEVRRVLDRSRLRDLGAALESAGRLAPTRPHPRTPTAPPANLVADPLAGAIDKARDLVRSARPDR